MTKILILCFILSFTHTPCILEGNYGPFRMFITKFDNCIGPKPKDCTFMNATIIGHGTIHVDFLVTQSCAPTKGKILALSNGKELVRLNMNKPCDHLFLRPLLEGMFNVTKSCVILKGHYIIKLEMEQIATRYFGGSFFYGNLTFKSAVFSNECNFSCTITQVTLSPKK